MREGREGREEGLEESDWEKEEYKREQREEGRKWRREERGGREGEGERVVCASLGLPSTEGGPFFSLNPSIGCLLHP